MPPVRQNYFVFLLKVWLHSIHSCNNKSYISLQQPRTDFYTGIRYSAPPPTNKNRTEQNKTIAFLHLTCQDGARHYSWRVKNLFCFCVKGRSFQVVNVSELSFIWKWPSYSIHCRHKDRNSGNQNTWRNDCKFSSVQLLSRVWLFGTPWPAGRQASVSITNSRGLLKLMSIESVMPSNHRTLVIPFSSAFNQDYERQIF